MPIRNGASPVASALGIRLGATPCGLTHPNMPFSDHPLKPDISTWQRIGHFYLALTHAVYEILLDQRAADVGLRVASVGGGVGHDERCTALRFQRGGKKIDPKVVAVWNRFLACIGFFNLGFVARNAVGVETFSTLLKLTSSTLNGGLART